MVAAASGEVVGVPPPRWSMRIVCSSQKMLKLFFRVACRVRRRPVFFHVPSLNARFSSGS